jgi:hypothetical protein
MQSVDWVKIAPEVAKQLLGEPKSISSTEMRWGTHGSMVLNLEKGTFYTFEGGFGGGVVDLIKYLNEDVTTVLKQFGYDQALSSDSLLSVSVTPPNGINKGNARSFDRKQMGSFLSEASIAMQYAEDFWVMRFPTGHRIKQKYAPFSKNIDGTWSLKRPEGTMPLYYKAKHIDKPILVSEGEKATLGAEKIYEGDCATWHGGVNSWQKSDWSPLYGKEVWIFPDNDEAGFKCANEIADMLTKNKSTVKVVTPPPHFEDKDDLWDAHKRDDFPTSGDLVTYIEGMDEFKEVKAPRASLYFQTVDEIMSNITEPDWLIDKCIERGTVTSIFGAAKSGKSFIAIDMACAVASGRTFYGYETKPATVLYLAGEGFTGVGRRIKSHEQHHDYSLKNKPLLVSNRGTRIGDNEDFKNLQEVCRNIEKEQGSIGMIIVDTLARNYGLNENSTEDMNKFIQHIDDLKEEFNASIIIVHHTGHGSGARSRGSSVLPAALDYEFKVDRDKNSDDAAMLVNLKQTLVKDGTPIDEMYLKFKEIELLGFKGVTSGVLLETDEKPKYNLWTPVRRETNKAIEDYQLEKNPKCPSDVWVKNSILASILDVKEKTMTGRLRDLANNDLVHYHEDKGYQSKRWDNELY